jgi:hypothetical protein
MLVPVRNSETVAVEGWALWNKERLETLIYDQLLKKLLSLLIPQTFITVFTRRATGPHPEPDVFSPYPPYFFKIHFNTISFIPWSSEWCLPFRFSIFFLFLVG